MRLWSLHPKHLDGKALVALWREGLLAQRVLLGETRGYRRHPQLKRFSESSDPVLAIGCYLAVVADEADERGYSFDKTKIRKTGTFPGITISSGQIEYEWHHLLEKLKTRAPEAFERNWGLPAPDVHPLFLPVPGGVEEWEKVKK